MRTGQRNKADNRGLTLVEVVVVIAIMAVAIGGTAVLGVAINNAKVKSCAQSIYSDLGRVKTNTMAKNKTDGTAESWFSLEKSGDKYILKEKVNGNEEQKVIGGKAIVVKYTDIGNQSDNSGSTGVKLIDKTLKCVFKRGTGAVDTGASNFTDIYVYDTGIHSEYRIRVYETTGKTQMEKTK